MKGISGLIWACRGWSDLVGSSGWVWVPSVGLPAGSRSAASTGLSKQTPLTNLHASCFHEMKVTLLLLLCSSSRGLSLSLPTTQKIEAFSNTKVHTDCLLPEPACGSSI